MSPEPRLVRLGIRVRAERAEAALADLLPLLEGGAEERDLGGAVEYAVYLPPGELPPPPQALRPAIADTARANENRRIMRAPWKRSIGLARDGDAYCFAETTRLPFIRECPPPQ